MKPNLKHISGPLTRACWLAVVSRRGEESRGEETFLVGKVKECMKNFQWSCPGPGWPPLPPLLPLVPGMGSGRAEVVKESHSLPVIGGKHFFFALYIIFQSSKCLPVVTRGLLPCSVNSPSCGLS